MQASWTYRHTTARPFLQAKHSPPPRKQLSSRRAALMCAAQQKTAVVTGARTGIGLEFAKQLLDKGYTVIAAVRGPSQQLKELQQANPATLKITTLDVASSSSIQDWAENLKRQTGESAVQLLINNAGIYGPRLTFDTVTSEDMIQTFTTNAIGPLLISQQLCKQGLIPQGAVIANVTSKVGSVDDNRSGGGYAYRASKSALNIINKSMSIDLEPQGITCVLLHPGYVRTQMTGGQGLIDASESVSGMLSVLFDSSRPLNGRWYDFAGKEVPW